MPQTEKIALKVTIGTILPFERKMSNAGITEKSMKRSKKNRNWDKIIPETQPKNRRKKVSKRYNKV